MIGILLALAINCSAISLPRESAVRRVEIVSGSDRRVNSSPDGHLEVEVHGPVSAFGEMSTAENNPIIQESFYYGASAEAWSFFINGGASTAAASSMITSNSGTETESLATIRTRRSLVYRPGQGSLGRYTAKFSTGVAGAIQFVGFGNAETALGFTTNEYGLFGVVRSSGGLRDLNALTIGTKSSNAQTATITLNGKAFSCAVTNGADTYVTANEIAACNYTGQYPGWIASVASATVTFLPTVPGSQTGTFSASFPTSGAGAFVELVAGKNPAVEFVAREDWNIDTMDGTGSTRNPSGYYLDYTKLGVYAVQFQFLGAGEIEFFVEDAQTGELAPVHRMKYSGREYTPSLSNPTMPFVVSSRNVGVAGNLSVSAASVGAFTQGPIRRTGQQRSYAHSRTGITSTMTPILTLRNSQITGTTVNQRELTPISVNINNTGTKGAQIQITEQSATSSNSYFVFVSTGNSSAKVDFTATSITGGIPRITRGVATVQGVDIDLQPFNLNIEPGNSLTISAKSESSGATTDLSVSLQWMEDF